MTREDKRRWTLLSYQGHNAAEGPVIADDERVEVMPVPPVEVTDEARELLAEVYRPEGVEVWLSGRNRSLGGERPIDLIERGEGARVLAHIRQISSSDPPWAGMIDGTAT